MNLVPSIIFERVKRARVEAKAEADIEAKKQKEEQDEIDVVRRRAANRRLRKHMESEARKLQFPFTITPEQRSHFGYDRARDAEEAWYAFSQILVEWNDLEQGGNVRYVVEEITHNHDKIFKEKDGTWYAGPDVRFTVDFDKVE